MVDLLRNPFLLPIKTQYAAGSRIKPIGKAFGCEHDRDACILCHEPQSVTGVFRIERDIGPAGFEHGHQSDNHFQ